MRLALVGTLLIVVLLSALTIETAHFVVVNKTTVTEEYMHTIATYLEEAYSTYKAMGLDFALPCEGNKYQVYVVYTGDFGARTYYRYWYYTDTGIVTRTCIERVEFAHNVSSWYIRPTAFHEMAHVAEYAYYRYVSIASKNSWVKESRARAMEIRYGGAPCYYAFFEKELYRRDPFSFELPPSGRPPSEPYDYYPFFYWLLDRMSPVEVTRNAFGGRDYSWVEGQYVEYLKAIAKGQRLCNDTVFPRYEELDLRGGGTAKIRLSLDGLSAAYYRVSVPRGAEVKIDAPGLALNLASGRWFKVENRTLLLALVNPSKSAASVAVVISVRANLTVRLTSATYVADGGVLKFRLSVAYGEDAVNGTVAVNGTRLRAFGGYVEGQAAVPGPGPYVLKVVYGNATAVVSLTAAVPKVMAPPVLYLSNSSRGLLKIAVYNPGDVDVETPLSVSAGGLSFDYPRRLVLKPGNNTVEVRFRAVGPPDSRIKYSVAASPNARSETFTVVHPVSVRVASAVFNGTHASVVLDYGLGSYAALFRGLSGVVEVPYGGYTLAAVELSLPKPDVRLRLYGDRGVLYVSAKVACPPYAANYTLPISANGTRVGSVNLACPASPEASAAVPLGGCARAVSLDLGFTRIDAELAPRLELRVANLSFYPSPIRAVLVVKAPSVASLNATVRLYVNGTEVGSAAVGLAPGEERAYIFDFTPVGPGLYVAEAKLWCAKSAGATYSVAVKRVELVAPHFVLLGNATKLTLVAEYWPQVPLRAAVELAGCVNKTLWMAPGEEAVLSFASACTLRATARLGNATASTSVRWGCLNVRAVYDRVGQIRGIPAVLEGAAVKAEVSDCDGSPLPAEAQAYGVRSASLAALGPETIKAVAKLYGQVNETAEEVVVVPNIYLGAVGLAAKLSPPAATELAKAVEVAAFSSDWSYVRDVVSAAEGSAGWPLSEQLTLWLIDMHLAHGWSLAPAETLGRAPWLPYAAIAIVASMPYVIQRRRKNQRSTSSQPQIK